MCDAADDVGTTVVEDLLGYTAAICLALMFVPQLIHTYRSKRTRDLSWVTLFLSVTASSLFSIFGAVAVWVRDDSTVLPVLVANVLTFSTGMGLVCAKYRYDGLTRRDVVACCTLEGLGLTAARRASKRLPEAEMSLREGGDRHSGDVEAGAVVAAPRGGGTHAGGVASGGVVGGGNVHDGFSEIPSDAARSDVDGTRPTNAP